MLSFYEKYSKFCSGLCPINCIEDEFVITKGSKTISDYPDLELIWDDSKPLIMYEETPVITFTDYFCYMGGLFGMWFGIWFGISANQLIEKIKENYAIYYQNLINYFRISILILLEILIIIKNLFLETPIVCSRKVTDFLFTILFLLISIIQFIKSKIIHSIIRTKVSVIQLKEL
jgi:hypothetical protein